MQAGAAMTEGSAGPMSDQLAQTSQADGFAIESMNALGRSPKPLGEFLVRMTGGGRVATIIGNPLPIAWQSFDPTLPMALLPAMPAAPGPPWNSQ